MLPTRPPRPPDSEVPPSATAAKASIRNGVPAVGIAGRGLGGQHEAGDAIDHAGADEGQEPRACDRHARQGSRSLVGADRVKSDAEIGAPHDQP